MLCIGSRAAAHHGLLPPGKLVTEENDWDFIMTWSEFQDFKPAGVIERRPLSERNWLIRRAPIQGVSQIIEVEIAWSDTAAYKLLEIETGVCPGAEGHSWFASPEALLALKLSHRYLKDSPHFLKTMRDIQWLRQCGITLGTEWLSWVTLRESETYTYKHPALNRRKDQFFTNNVKYIHDHDSLHRAVALGHRPAYESYKKDGVEVDCDRDKFDALPLQDRLNGVWEECAVLALERAVVPNGANPRWAFEKALEKVCTSITSGWFREFAWEHYDDILRMQAAIGFDRYVDMYYDGVQNGIVLPYAGEPYAAAQG